jgi:diketogulonate reductase-like aldo/keto reductase
MISRNLKVGNIEIPYLGMGTYQLRGTSCYLTLNVGISLGYRLIDSSPYFTNEKMVALTLSREKRSSLFLTSKFNQVSLFNSNPEASVNSSLKQMKTSYIDLLFFEKPLPNFINSKVLIDSRKIRAEAWVRVNKLKNLGMVKHVGLCNFGLDYIEEMVEDTGIFPEAIANEIHPLNYNKELAKYCQDNEIALIAHTPLARCSKLLVRHVDLEALAKKYSVTTIQMILKWTVSKNIVVLPRSSCTEHIRSNSLIDFDVSQEDMAIIDGLQIKMYGLG